MAILLGAELLLMLTDADGVFTADPRSAAEARLIPSVERFNDLDPYDIGHATSPLGSGGMRSKIVAAREATGAAIDCIRDGVMFGVVAGTDSVREVYPGEGVLVAASDTTRAAAKEAVSQLAAGGGTAMGRWLTLLARSRKQSPSYSRSTARSPTDLTRRA